MKTSDKVCIFIGFFLISMIIGHIIYDTTYSQKTTPKTYHVEYQFTTRDGHLVSFNSSYSAVLGDDPYKDKEISIEFLYVLVTNEILRDFYSEDYHQKKDEILYNINKVITTKVVQRFPDIEFQIIDIEIFNHDMGILFDLLYR